MQNKYTKKIISLAVLVSVLIPIHSFAYSSPVITGSGSVVGPQSTPINLNFPTNGPYGPSNPIVATQSPIVAYVPYQMSPSYGGYTTPVVATQSPMIAYAPVTSTTVLPATTGNTSMNTPKSHVLDASTRAKLIGVPEAKAATCTNDSETVTINYTNTDKSDWTNVMIKVMIPREATFVNASAGTYNDTDKSLTVMIGTLPKGTSGTLYVAIKPSAFYGNQTGTITTTADLYFTKADGTQSALHQTIVSQVKPCTSFAAFALGAGFFPHTVLGWIILVMIIVVIVYLARRFYHKKHEHIDVHVSH